MSFYPCRGGNLNLNNIVHKSFTSETGDTWITTYTLETSYKFGHVVTFNGTIDGVYVSLNGVVQAFELTQKGTYFLKSVLLRNLKKGDVLVVRGIGTGIFIK